jgi:four helix bundle protein
MAIEKFEDIECWRKAKELTLELYKIFSALNDYTFKNQILKASVSIMNNIAEGFERKSNKEFKQFLFISKGSAGEVRSMLHLGFDLKYLEKSPYNTLINNVTEISKMLSGFIKKL